MTTGQRRDFEGILRDRGMLPDGKVMTDAILVAAVESFGDTTEYVRIYPDGTQAHHVSVGLLETCLNELRALQEDDQ